MDQYDNAAKAFDRGLVLVDEERTKAKQKKPHQHIFSAKLVHYKLSYALLVQKNERWKEAQQFLLSVIKEYSPDKTAQTGVQLTGITVRYHNPYWQNATSYWERYMVKVMMA